jgi:hypothetical protein
LTKALKRAKELTQKGINNEASQPLHFFLSHKIELKNFDDDLVLQFSQLDDYDIMCALKCWQYHNDFILSSLSKMIIHRDLLKISLDKEKFSKEKLNFLKEKLIAIYPVNSLESDYFVFKGKVKALGYNKEAQPIKIVRKDKIVEEVVLSSDQLNSRAFSKPVTKYYICYPKVLKEFNKF